MRRSDSCRGPLPQRDRLVGLADPSRHRDQEPIAPADWIGHRQRVRRAGSCDILDGERALDRLAVLGRRVEVLPQPVDLPDVRATLRERGVDRVLASAVPDVRDWVQVRRSR